MLLRRRWLWLVEASEPGGVLLEVGAYDLVHLILGYKRCSSEEFFCFPNDMVGFRADPAPCIIARPRLLELVMMNKRNSKSTRPTIVKSRSHPIGAPLAGAVQQGLQQVSWAAFGASGRGGAPCWHDAAASKFPSFNLPHFEQHMPQHRFAQIRRIVSSVMASRAAHAADGGWYRA